MSKRIRQYIGIVCAIAAYYLIHEGAHLIVALYFGAFRKVRVMGLGIQVDVFAEQMTDIQMGMFCLSGVVATLLVGWGMIILAKQICQAKSTVFRAVMWYVSLVMLLLDPVYLSVLCGFFGGGDMNGIRLLLPEVSARILFAGIGVIHGLVIWKYLLPIYTKAFKKEE